MSVEDNKMPEKAKTASEATDENYNKISLVIDDSGKRTIKLAAKRFTMLLSAKNPNLCELIKLSKGLMSFFLGLMWRNTPYSTLCKESLETQTTCLWNAYDPEHDKQQNWLSQNTKEINTFENDVKKKLPDASVDYEKLDMLSITNSDIRPEDSISNVSINGSKHKGRTFRICSCFEKNAWPWRQGRCPSSRKS